MPEAFCFSLKAPQECGAFFLIWFYGEHLAPEREELRLLPDPNLCFIRFTLPPKT